MNVQHTCPVCLKDHPANLSCEAEAFAQHYVGRAIASVEAERQQANKEPLCLDAASHDWKTISAFLKGEGRFEVKQCRSCGLGLNPESGRYYSAPRCDKEGHKWQQGVIGSRPITYCDDCGKVETAVA